MTLEEAQEVVFPETGDPQVDSLLPVGQSVGEIASTLHGRAFLEWFIRVRERAGTSGGDLYEASKMVLKARDGGGP
jgi:hypothetical protein